MPGELDRLRRCGWTGRAPWIPEFWKRMTARRQVIADGLDHYWNFHAKPMPGCPHCWKATKDSNPPEGVKQKGLNDAH